MESINTKIITIYHTESPFIINHPDYLPMQSGKVLSDEDLGIQPDNEGENISNLASFGEQRCIYWAWKNLPPEVEIIGLNNYRRFFDFYGIGDKTNWLTPVPFSFYHKINYTVPEDIKKFVRSGGIVVGKSFSMKYSVEMQFKSLYGPRGLDLLEQVLHEKFGDKYDKAYHKWIRRSNRLTPCVLYLMNREQFNAYCEWNFPILFRLHELIDYSKLDEYNYRLIAFINERLFHLYIHAHNFKTKEIPFLLINKETSDEEYTEPSLRRDIGRWMINKCNDIGCSLHNLFCFHEFNLFNNFMDKITNRRTYESSHYSSTKKEMNLSKSSPDDNSDNPKVEN